MCKRQKKIRPAQPIGIVTPVANAQPRGPIGLVPPLDVESGYTALNSSIFLDNKISLNPGVKADIFDFNNWLRATFPSEDNVAKILKNISPKDKEQLMGFYLTSKDGEGKGPKSKNVLGSYNIDDLMELMKNLGSIQGKLNYKKELITKRMRMGKWIKYAVDGQNIREDISSSYSNSTSEFYKNKTIYGTDHSTNKSLNRSLSGKTITNGYISSSFIGVPNGKIHIFDYLEGRDKNVIFN